MQRKLEPFTMSIFVAMHIAIIAGAFFIQFNWQGFWLAYWLYVIRGFAITIGYHRYFSHRSFQTSRWFQFLLAFVATLSLQRGPLWWASWHRHHHIYSDTQEDVHSPTMHGFWRSHLGWMSEKKNSHAIMELVRDWNKFPEIVWLNNNHSIINIAFLFVIFMIGGWNAVYWGFVVSTVILWHATGSVNSICHLWGYRSYDTPDTSRNTWGLAPFTFGECWHNNHHHDQKSAKNGFEWWEVDLSYWIIQILATIKLIWNIQSPRHFKN